MNISSKQALFKYKCNGTDKVYPCHKTIQTLFEEQAEKALDSVAVVYEDVKLTYRYLNERSNQLAHYLIEKYDIKSDELIALCLDRNEHMIIAILGVLKAGGAYVPMDSSYPDERIKYVLEDMKAGIVLINKEHKERLCGIAEVDVVAIDSEETVEQISLESTVNPVTSTRSDNLAYVIYTSGTTGKPKGVMIEHKGVVNSSYAAIGHRSIIRNSKMLSSAPYVFDSFVLEIYPTLFAGGSLFISDEALRKDIYSIYDYCVRNRITNLFLTTKLAEEFLHLENDELCLTSLAVGGEKLRTQKIPRFHLVNEYGPTENTVCTTQFRVTGCNKDIPIGKPIANTRCYVLGKNLGLVPIGSVGELYIGGDGLARGYLNREELTREKFISNPFQTKEEKKQNKNSRIYRTGDLVRWLPDGNLEYIGRNDFQVKIRGHRIELGEIEKTLANYKGIRQSVVLAKERKVAGDTVEEDRECTKYLVGYYVSEPELEEKNKYNFINSWKELYQIEYSSLDINTFKRNIGGWNSSYTGDPIVKEEMLEWINESVEKIKNLSPKVILEIGSGSGLMLFNIIDCCDYYYATDFSENAINYTRKVIDIFGYSNKVMPKNWSADKILFEKLEIAYDTVILNSVVQYFPDIEYFEKVITKAIANINDCGQVFIGDVRDYRLLEKFYYSVLKYQYGKVAQAEIEYCSKREKELLISPAYFVWLKTTNNNISRVDIIPKLGHTKNEMNDFRYDVILHINNKQKALEINESNFIQVSSVEDYVKTNQYNKKLLIKCLNTRIQDCYSECNILYDVVVSVNKEDIRRAMSLSEITQISKAYHYNIKVFVDIKSPLYFYVVLYKKENISEKNICINYNNVHFSENYFNKPLIASSAFEAGSNKKLKEYLYQNLPEYMVPSILVRLDKLPLTVNGKLDRKALPDPKFIDSDNYVGPRNDIERKMCQIWGEVLGVEGRKVGIQDDFFRLGGDSIVSIQLVSRMRQRFGLQISIKDIFLFKSIERICKSFLSKNRNLNIRTEQGILEEEVKLLPIQEWFFDNKFLASQHWNQSFMVRVSNLDIVQLQRSIDKLALHHDSLRLRYKSDRSGSYVQYYDNDVKGLELKILDIRALEAREGGQKFQGKLIETLTKWKSEFNLEKGPIYSIGYIYGYADGSARIHFALHHLIVDTISWKILAEDLRDIYEGKELGLKGSNYRQWINTIREYAKWHTVEEREYWKSVLREYDSNRVAKLATDTFIYSSLELSQEQTKLLMQQTNRAYNTEINDILLTALGYALREITGNRSNHIVSEGHGREKIDAHIDITKTVGCFMTMYPVKLEVSEDIGLSIRHIKEELRHIPNRGIGYGALERYKREQLPRIRFNYLGQFDQRGIGSWKIVNENNGILVDNRNKEDDIVNINGLIIDGSLQFGIVSKLSKENTSKLSKVFKEKLELIIKHTINQNRSYLTISDIDRVTSAEYLNKIQDGVEIEGVYLANSLQEGFIYHALNQGDVDDAYIVQLIWGYKSNLDVSKLKEAWNCTQKRFSSLRLRFLWQEELVQVIDKKGKLDWRYIDLSKEIGEQERKKRIKEIKREDRKEVYRLEEGNLFRVYLIKQREDLYTCIYSYHHAILDGWSWPILYGYIHETYLKLLREERISIAIERTYEEAQKYLQKRKEKHESYWERYVGQIEEKVNLSGLLSSDSKVVISEYKHIKRPKEQALKIKDDLYKSLKEISRTEGVTINSILQYVWHKVLSVYGNSNQTVVGVTVSGRNLPINDIERSVGLYINTLPLIVNHSNGAVIDAIKEIQENISEINIRSSVNLAKIQKGGERLFDSLFVYENYPNAKKEEVKKSLCIKFKGVVEKLDYPLGIVARDGNKEIIFKIHYAGELFDEEVIKRLLIITKELLGQIANNSGQNVEKLNYLSQAHYKEVAYKCNGTDKVYPCHKTIQTLFEEQAEKALDSVAVVYEDVKLTYRYLNERSNQLAHYLIEKYDIKSDELIALCLDRNEHMIIAILGVLKAGGAYVPMDSSYPDERIKYVLEDMKAGIVLINKEHKERLCGIAEVDVVAIDSEETVEQISLESTVNPVTSTRSDNLAYVIYTSGTTGKPKGVMIEHKGVVNSSYAAIGHRSIIRNSKMLSSAPYVFDSFVLEIYPTLFAGGSLFISDEALRKDIYSIYDYCVRNRITNLFLTTKLAEEFLHLENDELCLTSLAVGGEKLRTQKIPRFHLVNEYGPTENTVCTTQFRVTGCNKDIPIGKPIANTRCYVLGKNLGLVPIGSVGELYIGGDGLARGYLNREELTREKFISNPFQTKEEKKQNKNSRIYRTGDLVRWLPDGNLEYIGRNDFQVKIRGHRIELGEIEKTLANYKGIRQSVVLAKERKVAGDTVEEDRECTKYLVGYYVSEPELEEKNILSFLENKLPWYMLPNIWVRLDNLPLTINGKLDRKALPDPKFTDKDNYVRPRNDIERKMCQIWGEALRLDESKVGIRDDFFRLGGDSIISIQLVSRIRQRLDLHINVKDIFLFKTIEKLCENVLKQGADNAENEYEKFII